MILNGISRGLGCYPQDCIVALFCQLAYFPAMCSERSQRQEQMLSYLEQLSDTIPGGQPHRIYRNIPELILDAGRFMPSAPLPSAYSPGELKACYYNSQVLALAHSELTYVEGYAMRDGLSFALPHAWVMAEDGHAIDPTWVDNQGCYLGVALETDWLLELLSDRTARGWPQENAVFDGNHLEQFSFLENGLPSDALAPINHLPLVCPQQLRHTEDGRPR